MSGRKSLVVGSAQGFPYLILFVVSENYLTKLFAT